MAMNSVRYVPESEIEATVAADQARLDEMFQRNRYVVCSSVDVYRKLQPMDWEGCDLVYEAVHRNNHKTCTIKKIETCDPNGKGLPQDAYSEIRVLKQLRHENVLTLLDIVVGSKLESIFMVFEHCIDDFQEIIKGLNMAFVQAEVKCIMTQYLSGLDYVHKQKIIHRELTSAKLLLDDTGIVKISGFHAAIENGNIPLNPDVGSQFYRAPELIFGSEHYTEKIDIWSTGCIFAEILKRKRVFPAENDQELIDMIIELLGTPNDRVMPGFRGLPLVDDFELEEQPFCMISRTFDISTSGKTLMKQLFLYDPEQRCSAEKALSSDYFTEAPLPCRPVSLKLAIFQKRIKIKQESD